MIDQQRREDAHQVDDRVAESLHVQALARRELDLESQLQEAATEQLEHARTYVIERVQERPFTTTLAVLGAGFLIGVLFAGRRK